MQTLQQAALAREQQFQLISIYSFVLSEVAMRVEKLNIFLLILFYCGNSNGGKKKLNLFSTDEKFEI
jgi:hypothetical protein